MIIRYSSKELMIIANALSNEGLYLFGVAKTYTNAVKKCDILKQATGKIDEATKSVIKP